MVVDNNYVIKLEKTIEEQEIEIERLSSTYEHLALACARGTYQKKLILKQAYWNDETIVKNLFDNGQRGFNVGIESKRNLYSRIMKAKVAHLRLHSKDSPIKKLGTNNILTEYGPPPKDKQIKKYCGMDVYVY